MACDVLSKGRKLACKDSRVGIKQVDFTPFVDEKWDVLLNEISLIPASVTEVFPYIVKSTGNSLVETPTVDPTNRTTEIKAVVSLALQKLTKESEVELQALLYGRLIAFVHDYNGNVHVVGIDSGLEATSGLKSTDTNGYTLTLEATDNKFCPYLSSTAITALKALATTDFVDP